MSSFPADYGIAFQRAARAAGADRHTDFDESTTAELSEEDRVRYTAVARMLLSRSVDDFEQTLVEVCDAIADTDRTEEQSILSEFGSNAGFFSDDLEDECAIDPLVEEAHRIAREHGNVAELACRIGLRTARTLFIFRHIYNLEGPEKPAEEDIDV